MRAFPPRRLSVSLGFVFLCAIILACAGVVAAQSQSTAADLAGFVRDQTGAVVAGATVTARNTATNQSRMATTNDQGFY